MAGSRPGETNGRATGCTLINMFNPLPHSCIRLAIDYDFNAMGPQLAKISHLSYEEKLDFVSKNMERFKKPNAFGRFPNKGKAKAKEEEEEEEEKSHVEDENEEEEKNHVEDENEEEEKSHVENENEEEDTESDSEDEEDEMDEDELMVDDTKPATDGQLQVPHEGERECKKPRYAQGSSCQAEAAAFSR